MTTTGWVVLVLAVLAVVALVVALAVVGAHHHPEGDHRDD